MNNGGRTPLPAPKRVALMPVPTLVHGGRDAPLRSRFVGETCAGQRPFGSLNIQVSTCGSHAALLIQCLEMLRTRALSLISGKEVASFVKADSIVESIIVFFSSPRT